MSAPGSSAVAPAARQLFAVSGVLTGDRSRTRRLIEYAVSLAPVSGRPVRFCFLPTAEGDHPAAVQWFLDAFGNEPGLEASVFTVFPRPSAPPEHLLTQDVIWVGGGSVVNLMALWRAHGIDAVLRECRQRGVVLAGQSAGSLCWHAGGVTDSVTDQLDAYDNCLGWLPWSNGVHDDLADQPRRTAYRKFVAEGTLPPGYATEDGVGLHYVDGELHEAVSVLPDARAWYVTADGEREIVPRLI
ncbi:Type 1 glutamine amidotransferase-like domain-containing protein [Kribbella sp. CA-253562]|uniref:Type 1 glutamine amidotransferase-like domain-containing protein n=1 Tax=Kribbella sp. CA-253562 TaxID=3239942 RepID=UPI003D90B685